MGITFSFAKHLVTLLRRLRFLLRADAATAYRVIPSLHLGDSHIFLDCGNKFLGTGRAEEFLQREKASSPSLTTLPSLEAPVRPA